MYCTSIDFINKMQNYINKIEEKSDGVLIFVESIILPYFGNTILRFNINQVNYTLDDLDVYEAFMQSIVEDEFLVDFMGNVYQKIGFEPQMYDEKFRKCYHTYMDVPITPRDDHTALKKDAALLLGKCGVSPTLKVWEMQIEEEITLFVLGEKNRKIGTYALVNDTIHIYEVEEMPCIGLMRAIMYARTQHISMGRVLLES